MINGWTFWVRGCEQYLSQLTFSSKRLIDNKCSISRSGNHICDYGFKCLSQSLMGTVYLRSQLASQNVLQSSASPLCVITEEKNNFSGYSFVCKASTFWKLPNESPIYFIPRPHKCLERIRSPFPGGSSHFHCQKQTSTIRVYAPASQVQEKRRRNGEARGVVWTLGSTLRCGTKEGENFLSLSDGWLSVNSEHSRYQGNRETGFWTRSTKISIFRLVVLHRVWKDGFSIKSELFVKNSVSFKFLFKFNFLEKSSKAYILVISIIIFFEDFPIHNEFLWFSRNVLTIYQSKLNINL